MEVNVVIYSTKPRNSIEYIRLAYTKPVNRVFRVLWLVSYLGISQDILGSLTAHGSDNMASRFPENLSEAQISKINEKVIPINKKKATKFVLGVFQGKVLFLNIILRLSFTREAETVTLTRKNCQLPSLFTNFKIRQKNWNFFSALIHWFGICYCNYSPQIGVYQTSE